MTDQPRRRAGTPIGGQFAGHSRPEGDVNLTSPAPSAAQQRLLADLSSCDTIYLEGPGEQATQWDRYVVCNLYRDGQFDVKSRVNAHAVQQLLDDGLLEAVQDDRADAYLHRDGRRSRTSLALSGRGRDAIAGAVPKKPTAVHAALGWVATGTVYSWGEGADSRTVVRKPTVERLLADGLVAVDEKGYYLALTDAGRAELNGAIEAEQTASVQVAVSMEHQGKFSSVSRGRAAYGSGGNLRRGAASCSCGWKYQGNESMAAARSSHAEHVKDEVQKALAVARL